MNTIRYAVCDLNGIARGKRTPACDAKKLSGGSARMPRTCLNLDLWGEDIEDSPLLFDAGDADGMLLPTDRGAVPMPWLPEPSELHPMWMFEEDGSPFAGDPRHALNEVIQRFARRGWNILAATELEFTLVDPTRNDIAPPKDPMSGKPAFQGHINTLETLDAFDAFFTDLYAACDAMDIPAQTAISEGGVGQFEVNLTHQNAMKAADDTWLFKHMVRGVARKHNLGATFMAKPYPDDAGNGMHVHFSVVDQIGKNIFDNGGSEGSELLISSVAGCLQAANDSTLIFAPHANSFARLVPGAHAPTSICWGYENRTAAIRIPGGPSAARRVEHRVAGGDTNPYLMLAAILGAALNGIEGGLSPPPPIAGNAYDQEHPQLASSWNAAIDAWENSLEIRRIFPPMLIDNLTRTKRQEMRKYQLLDAAKRIQLLLDVI